MGNKIDLQKAIELLDEVKESIINAYEMKTHLSRAKIAKMMDEETWLNAKKALQLGFVDGILFAEKQQKNSPVEPEKEESAPETPEEDTPNEQKTKNLKAMSYSSKRTADSLTQKLSELHKSTGVPINQLEKRLNLLKY